MSRIVRLIKPKVSPSWNGRTSGRPMETGNGPERRGFGMFPKKEGNS